MYVQKESLHAQCTYIFYFWNDDYYKVPYKIVFHLFVCWLCLVFGASVFVDERML